MVVGNPGRSRQEVSWYSVGNLRTSKGLWRIGGLSGKGPREFNTRGSMKLTLKGIPEKVRLYVIARQGPPIYSF